MTEKTNSGLPDLLTEEGRREAMKIIRREERARFLELQRELANQINDDVLREEMEAAIARMEAVP